MAVEVGNVCFDQLPKEILLKIFCYLTSTDILTNIALVCKKFHKLSQDYSLFDEITIRDWHKPSMLIRNALKVRYKYNGFYKFLDSKKIRRINFDKCTDDTIITNAIKILSQSLTCVNIKNSTVHRDGLKSLVKLEHLKHLHLEKNLSATPATFIEPYIPFTSIYLETLKISDNEFYGAGNWSFSHLSKSMLLQELEISILNLNEIGLENISRIKYLKKLTLKKLTMQHISEESLLGMVSHKILITVFNISSYLNSK